MQNKKVDKISSNYIYINYPEDDNCGFFVFDCNINTIKNLSYLNNNINDSCISFTIAYIDKSKDREITRSYKNKNEIEKKIIIAGVTNLHKLIKDKVKSQTDIIHNFI